jgi:hypothetical protein
MTWHLRGTYVEFCSCDPGCGCNFKGSPTSPEGNCEAFTASRIEDGQFNDVDLTGATVAWALWWPGAIHNKGGYGHAYVDCENDDQFDAVSAIWRGEAGYSYFEIFNSTFVEPTAVERASVMLTVAGKTSRIEVAGVAVAQMEPLRNPVTGDENEVRIVKPGGFIWKDGTIAKSSILKVDLSEMSFEVADRHAVFGPFEWAT